MHFIVKLEELEGSCSRIRLFGCDMDGNDFSMREMYCIILVHGGRAEIVDNGYHTYEEAKSAWPHAN